MKYIRILSCLFLFFTDLSAATKAGEVIATEGSVKAILKNLEEKILSRGSPVYIEEKIQTGPGARVQIRLLDETILTLIPDTEYTIDSYSFKGVKESFYSQLFKGGLRMISGSIAKTDPQAVSIKTPSAVMGLRGTIFSIRVEEDGAAYFSCESGCVNVSNAVSHLTLCPSTGQQFALFPSMDQQPLLFSSRPAPLNLKNFAPPKTKGCS